MTKEIVTCPSCGKKNRIRDRANAGRPKCANCKSYLSAESTAVRGKTKWGIGLALLVAIGLGIFGFKAFQSETKARATLDSTFPLIENEFRDFFGLRILEGTKDFGDEERLGERMCTFARSGFTAHRAECKQTLWIYKSEEPIQQTFTYHIEGTWAQVVNVQFEHSEVNDGRLNKNRYAVEKLMRLVAPMTFRQENFYIPDAFNEAREAPVGQTRSAKARVNGCDIEAGGTRKSETDMVIRISLACERYTFKPQPDWRSDRAIIRATQYWVNKTDQSTKRPDQSCTGSCVPTSERAFTISFVTVSPEDSHVAAKWAKVCGYSATRDTLPETASRLSADLGFIGRGAVMETVLSPQFHYEILAEELRLAERILERGKSAACKAMLRDYGPQGMVKRRLILP